VDSGTFASPMRSGSTPSRVSPAPIASKLDTTPELLLVLVVHLRGGRGGWAAQVEASSVGAPCAATPPPVKTSSGCAWLAVRALPRHASQVCTWAIGECLSPPPPALFFSGLSPRPSWPTAPSSLCWCYSYCLLLAWCLPSVKCGCAIACGDLAASQILWQCTFWQTC
jgi:hypothetical protein